MSLYIFGIRHHGPGSARSLLRALAELQPDCLLIEGPPDAEAALPLLTHEQMEPPVALLVYQAEQPQRAVFYPFAIFSPEWQALQFGLSKQIPTRFMDLPQTHWLALTEQSSISNLKSPIQSDPIGVLAQAAGYDDSERWWEYVVEQRRDGADLFAALLEAMAALRAEAEREVSDAKLANAESGEEAEAEQSELNREASREALREAWMRQTIRGARKEGLARIAVVCGAWHAPMLTDEVIAQTAKPDAALLKGLPKVKVQATWTPWTHGRLSYQSGYGAGIEAPGWYQHLWLTQEGVATRWLARVARLLRDEGLDVSSAHVIEAVRLAETLAALRGRPLTGLPELNEAVQSVFCFGDNLPLRLIHEKLIVGETLGRVPDETPLVPLQQDLQREQKRLRLKAEANEKTLDLDLRKETDLERSRLLHRLNLLGVPWGAVQGVSGKSGTFHELWRVRWQPEFVVQLIEAGVWGSTLQTAASSKARDKADKSDLPALTGLLQQVLLSALPDAVAHLMARLQTEAALASDVGLLMDALPPLANVQRYSDVRQTDAALLSTVTDGLVARICIGLPGACASLNDEAAQAMFARFDKVNAAIQLLQQEAHTAQWQQTLLRLAEQHGLHGQAAMLAGRACRLLLDAQALDAGEAARRLSLALSSANEPTQAGAWVEGFLHGSGLLLLHDEVLWQVLDAWLTALPEEQFIALLPLLRRTFANFTAPERRQMGERVARGPSGAAMSLGGAADFDEMTAAAVLPLAARLLGLQIGPNASH
ncbi:MAG: hypothetical protein HYR56_25175 [Acidobacteria bacterium]|nr:hypothetical protein [Acidobacteriota bacterium]MBI3421825.1 hypothetical protein [Acidobacteriota bacterium]